MEVADTNVRGNDSRLYASGAPGLGATMEEALTMNAKAAPTNNAVTTKQNSMQEDNAHGNYRVPSELYAPTSRNNSKKPQQSVTTIEKKSDLLVDDATPKQMPRGGWQADETVFYSNSPDDAYGTTNPYDAVRENEFEQLHHQLYTENGMVVPSPQPLTEQRYVVTIFLIVQHQYSTI